jgi:hypothetical protein
MDKVYCSIVSGPIEGGTRVGVEGIGRLDCRTLLEHILPRARGLAVEQILAA